MADELQSGICGGNWWNSSRGMFGSSPCSTAVNDMGSFGWPTELVDIKARCSTTDIESAGSVSDGPIVFQDLQRPQQPDSPRGDTTVLMESTLQMMGIGLSSSSTMDWNQTLLSGRADESTYDHSMLQEDMNLRLNYKQSGMDCPDQDQKGWVSSINLSVGSQDSSLHHAFKPGSQGFSDEPAGLNGSLTSSGGDSPGTCQQQALPTSFSMSPAASYGYPPTLLQSLFYSTLPDHQPQQPMFDKQLMNTTPNFHPNLNHQFPSLMPKFSSSSPKPSVLPKLQSTTHLHFTNNTPFWNASPANSMTPMQSQFLASTFEEKQPNCPNLTAKLLTGEVREPSSVAKKISTEPAFKRARVVLETPSPLPTFKVRKEKLGDRITALQQLVSPFGKTDTASVLHEAIEYIKFLHEQVGVLSTPYMKNGAPVRQQQTSSDKMKEPEGLKQDLRSRGLCLVPISSTFPVANETTTDFWTPTFGGTFR